MKTILQARLGELHEIPTGSTLEIAETFLGLPEIMGSIRVVNANVYFWEDDHWRMCSPFELRDAVSLFVGTCWYNAGRGRIVYTDASAHRVQSVLKLIEARRRVDVASVPAWIGESECPFNPEFTVSLKDCLVDLAATASTGVWSLQPKTKDWFDTVVLPFTYAEMMAQETPVLDRTLEQWSGGDPEWVELLMRMTGYAMMPYRGYQRAFLQVGKKRGGKSTWVRVLQALVGKRNTFSTDLERVVYTHGLVEAEGKRMIFLEEVGRTSQNMGSTLRRYINTIVGRGDSVLNIKGGMCYGHPLEGVVIMVGNDLPEIEDDTDSFWNKVCILPYNYSFLGQENFNLEAMLLKELSGVARKALEAAVRLIQAEAGSKWPQPLGAQEKRTRLARANTPVTAFVESRCKQDWRMTVSKDDLYKEYQNWCRYWEEPVMARNAFFRKLWDSGLKVQEYRQGPRGAQELFVRGLGLDPSKDLGR